MRAQEFLAEELVRANDLEHLRNRAKLIVRLVEPIAEHPLVYREFATRMGDTVLLKVTNTDRKEFAARSGSNPKQAQVLEALGIKNPVFCTMNTPYSTGGFFGGANIFVPGADYSVVWSPVVQDLGGNDIVGPDADKYGHEKIGAGSYRGPSAERQVGVEFVDTYKSGWPSGHTDNELIFDCKTYYLLNIKDFLRRFAGTQNRNIVSGRGRIDQEVFRAKFSRYSDIAWYLSNTLPGYLDWYEANVLNKSPEVPA